MVFTKDQIVEVEVKTRRGQERWIGQVIKVTPTRVQFYYMRRGPLSFSMIRRWALIEDVRPATAMNRRVWDRAVEENGELVRAIREVYVTDKEAMKGYASSL